MNGKDILIVEDDYLENLALCEILQDCGYQTETAYCAASAMEAIRRRPPSVLVTDLDLGPGATGFDVARFARSADPAMPVLYVSGNDEGRFPRDGVEGSGFLAKPYRGDRIIAMLRELINAPLGVWPGTAAPALVGEPSRRVVTLRVSAAPPRPPPASP